MSTARRSMLLAAVLCGVAQQAAAQSTEAAPAPAPAPTQAPAPAPRADGGGAERVALALGGLAGFAAGTVWFLELGDTLASGDGSAMLIGGGLIAALGAATGGLAVVTLDDDESAFDDRAFTPPVALSVGAGGTSTIGESEPLPVSLALTPRLALSDRLRLTPSATGHLDLGSAVAIDPRPQGTGTTALTTTSRGADLDVELRYFPGADPSSTRIDLIWRPMTSVRWSTHTYADGSERGLRRTEILPATLGARWHLSGRQRFEAIAGPRIDHISWSQGSGSASAPAYPGRLYLAATYQVGFQHARPLLGSRATSRLQGRYVHTTFDGVGANASALIGYFGPFEIDYDLRLRKRPTAWAVQAGLTASLADGGGAVATIGLVPPAQERP